eukprot:8543400-Pyramimonas_sp.AAC.1
MVMLMVKMMPPDDEGHREPLEGGPPRPCVVRPVARQGSLLRSPRTRWLRAPVIYAPGRTRR